MPCSGPLSEEVSCMPIAAISKCVTPAPLDCELASWSLWSLCDKECGGGQSKRSREPKRASAAGRPCAGALTELRPCNTELCHGVKDCELSDWSEWGACQSCGGERSRNRHVVAYPENGGKPCPTGAIEELEKCDRRCNMVYCGWTSWRDW